MRCCAKNEELPQRSARNGRYLLDRLQPLRAHPTVGDVRGRGLMCAVELVKDKATKEPFGWGPAATAHPYGRLVAATLMGARAADARRHGRAALLCPPLVIGREEIDRMVGILDESLTLAEREFGFV